jgi:hypothetical protein
MKDKIESKPQIYGVYWKYENLLSNVWTIINENTNLYAFKEIKDILIDEITGHPFYKDTEIQYLPREAFVEAVIRVFYKLYYPSENLKTKFQTWEKNV